MNYETDNIHFSSPLGYFVPRLNLFNDNSIHFRNSPIFLKSHDNSLQHGSNQIGNISQFPNYKSTSHSSYSAEKFDKNNSVSNKYNHNLNYRANLIRNFKEINNSRDFLSSQQSKYLNNNPSISPNSNNEVLCKDFEKNLHSLNESNKSPRAKFMFCSNFLENIRNKDKKYDIILQHLNKTTFNYIQCLKNEHDAEINKLKCQLGNSKKKYEELERKYLQLNSRNNSKLMHAKSEYSTEGKFRPSKKNYEQRWLKHDKILIPKLDLSKISNGINIHKPNIDNLNHKTIKIKDDIVKHIKRKK